MDLKNASIDDISMELSRRDQPFFLILAKPDNPEAQFHCYQIPPKIAINLLEDGAKVMRTIIEDGKIPENCRILKKVTKNGVVVDEVEITEISDLFDDPWSPKNAIGDFNPWKEVDEVEGEVKKDVVEGEVDPPEDGFDPWSKKDEL
jgi:hypothetical protein